MQGVAVPVWVAVVVITAIPVGLVVGAWLGRRAGEAAAARLDDERWHREREREDVRWERERDREEERWQRESERDELRWQRQNELRGHEASRELWERRLAAFGQFLASFEKVHGAACLLSVHGRSTGRAQESLNALEDGVQEAMHAFDVLRVLAGPDIVQACYDVLDNATKCWDHGGSADASARALDNLVQQREGLYARIREAVGTDR